MSEHLVYVLYFICIVYVAIYSFIFINRKYIKKDEKLIGVSFFKFFLDTSKYKGSK